jgi:hypothetical protein
MLWLGLTLVALAAVLLALALRGRVVARGRFCRKCRFDLAGLDPDRPDVVCPECGRPLAVPGSTRQALRRPRRSASLAAGLFLLLAIPVLLTQSPAVRAWLLPRLPDAAIARFERLDLEGADDEIVVRLSDPANLRTAFAGRIDRAVDAVLADKLSAPPADRAVVLAALRNAQFSGAQAARFFEAIIKARVVIRDRAHPDQRWVPSAWSVDVPFADYFTPQEMYSGGDPAYSVAHEFHHGGPASTPLIDRRGPPDGLSSALRFIGSRVWQPADSTPLRLTEQPLAPGDSIDVRAALNVHVYSPRSTTAVMSLQRVAEQTVAIIPADEPLLPILDDPDALAALASTLAMRDCKRRMMGDDTLLFALAFIDAPSAAHAAFRATLTAGNLVLVSERAIAFAPSNVPASRAQVAFHASLRDADTLSRVRALPASATADIVLRPDVDAAYAHAELASCLSGEIIFRDIPITATQNRATTHPLVYRRAEVHDPSPSPGRHSPEP